MKKLNVEIIDLLLESLNHSGFMPKNEAGTNGMTAEFFDSVCLTLGCSDNLMLNRNHSPSDGLSPAIGGLMYQNLLLAKRVSEIEGLFKLGVSNEQDPEERFGIKTKSLDEQELEEIIRQAYFIGVMDVQNNHPSVKAEYRRDRVKQIVSGIDFKKLEPFNYEKWLSK